MRSTTRPSRANHRRGRPSRSGSGPRISPGQRLLQDAVLWLDASRSVEGEQAMVNKGTGGSALNAQYGSTAGADTNDPKLLTHTGTNYLYLPGSTTNHPTAPDSAALDITGDLEIVLRCAPTSVASGDLLWKESAYGIYFTGSAVAGLVKVGGVNAAANSAAHGLVADVPVWLKVTRVAATGVWSFYKAGDQATEPSSWTTISAGIAGTSGAIDASTGILRMGSNNLGGTFAENKLMRVILRNGIGGTTVFDADFTAVTSGAATSFTESSANAATVTINRATSGRKTTMVVRPVLLFGTDDYLEVADSALLDIEVGDTLTALAVVRDWNNATIPIMAKRSVYSGTGAVGWTMGYASSFRAHMDTEDAGGVRVAEATATSALVNGGRYVVHAESKHVGPGRTVQAFVNGVGGAVASGPTQTSSLANAEAFRIGRLSGAGTAYGAYEVSAVAVFRRALTADEIAAICAYYGTV